jgi:hypothetical protein
MLTLNRGIALALVAMAAFAVWRVALPAERQASEDVADAAVTLLDTRSDARFAVAQVNLETQRRVTGSYAGAAMPGGAVLVRADGAGYCVQVGPPGTVSHLAGPGGAAAVGAC